MMNDQKYILDSSTLIDLHHMHTKTIALPERIWADLDRLFESGTLLSHAIVYNEIALSKQATKKDSLSEWIEAKKEYFINRSGRQAELVQSIVHDFPALIQPDRERPQADPWIIALAIEQKESSQSAKYVVVTQEDPASSKKIPAACKYFEVPCINFKQFFNEVDIHLS